MDKSFIQPKNNLRLKKVSQVGSRLDRIFHSIVKNLFMIELFIKKDYYN